MQRFEQFIKERQFLCNVSPATVSWYQCSFKWLQTDSPTDSDLKSMVLRMREKGLKATGVNAVIRAVNAYLKWAGSPLHVAKLKEPSFVPSVFTPDQVKRLIAWRPSSRCDKRLHLLCLTLLDTGCRISEALGLRVDDVDFDSMLLLLHGKGRKDRRVPMSLELRRVIFKYVRDEAKQPTDFLMATLTGRFLDKHVALRNVKHLCMRLGFEPPPRTLHAFRHTAACNYIRRGGSVFHLQKMLGHTSLEMSRRYANLSTDDLSAVHQRLSLLGQ